MDKDLKRIKKHYGEKMMHLCRDLFYRILETEGLLPKLLEEHFAKDRHLAEKIENQGMVDEFKSYIYSFVDVESTNKAKIANLQTAEELMDKAGYVLLPECKSEEEIQVFKQYYAPGEALCTFRGGRLNSCRVWFAVKKNFKDIKRENFPNPSRQDEYGTSVISIQFSRRNSALSIKNRYNHTVNNPDNTFNSDLDNIVNGLSDAFERDYGVRDKSVKKSNFELEGYVNADGKFYNYNHEINNIYYCENNVIIDNFQAKTLPTHQMLVDYFIFDFAENKVFLYDKNIKDSFIESLCEIENLEFENPNILVKVKNGRDIIITIDDKRRIIGLSNENMTQCGDFFLKNNESLTEVNLPNLRQCGNSFLYYNKSLTEISLPNLIQCGFNFLHDNTALSEIRLPNLIQCGDSFLKCNKNLSKLNLPNLTQCGVNFLHGNTALTEISLPKLKQCGKCFLYCNKNLSKLNLPKLKQCGDYFLYNNKVLKEINLPNLTQCGDDFLFSNKNRNKFSRKLNSEKSQKEKGVKGFVKFFLKLTLSNKSNSKSNNEEEIERE